MLYIASLDDGRLIGVGRLDGCQTINIYPYAFLVLKSTDSAGPASRCKHTDRASVRQPELSPRPLVWAREFSLEAIHGRPWRRRDDQCQRES